MVEGLFVVAPVTAKYWCDGVENNIIRRVLQNDETDVLLTIDGTNGTKCSKPTLYHSASI